MDAPIWIGLWDNIHSEWWMLDENEYPDMRKQHFYECLTIIGMNHAKVQLVMYVSHDSISYVCLHC